MTHEIAFVKLAVKLLDDDDGVSEEAYTALLDLGELIRPELCLQLNKVVKAAEGRFYLPDDWKRHLPECWSQGT